jgi:acetylglutamate kinase
MRFVIEVDPAGCAEEKITNAFANALRQLRSEGHQIVVIYPLLIEQHADNRHDNGVFPVTRAETLVDGSLMSSRLLAALKAAGVPAIGLSGADGDCLRLKVRRKEPTSIPYTWETAVINPFWLDVIALHGGVPIVCNIGLGPDSRYHAVCADQLAGVCAAAWQADVLIFFTAEDGIRNSTGTVMRWLEVAEPTTLSSHLAANRHMHSKLSACYDALNAGVHRARILPISKIHTLSVFCSERIDFGTEIVMGACAARI